MSRISKLIELLNENEGYNPPNKVVNNAKLGLKYRKQYGRGGISTKEAGDLGIGSGVARAVSLSQGQKQSKETIKMMYNFFNRHSAFKKHHTDNPPSNSLISWLLWGGDEGRDWVESIVKSDNV